MGQRIKISLYIATIFTIAGVCFYRSKPEDPDQEVFPPVRSVWAGGKEIKLQNELFSLDYTSGSGKLIPSPDATEVVSLFCGGGYWNRTEQNVLVEKMNDVVRLRSWWKTINGEVFLIDTTMEPNELDRLWQDLENLQVFTLDDGPRVSDIKINYLDVKRGNVHHQATGQIQYQLTEETIQANTLDARWGQVVNKILRLRSMYAHSVQLAGISEYGAGVSTGSTSGEVLIDEFAAKNIGILNDGIALESLSWETVLDIGYYRNQDSLEAVALLLDSPRNNVSAAACSVMSWLSGQPPSKDREHWKRWWKTASENDWSPRRSDIEGPYGDGVIQNLGSHSKGFIDIENDKAGNAWALVKTDSSRGRETFQLYELNRQTDQFVPSAAPREYSSNFSATPSVRFFRQVSDSKIDSLNQNLGLWVSADGNWGAAILGQENSSSQEAVVVIDFKNARILPPLQTNDRYASPVVSTDGAFVAVAKAWRWSSPNGIAVINTKTRTEQSVPIPRADYFDPVAYVDNSMNGPGFLLLRIDSSEEKTIWWSSVSGDRAEQLVVLSNDQDIQVGGSTNVTSDGSRIFLSQPHPEESSRQYGWLDLSSGSFEPVFETTSQIPGLDTSQDGNQVVFIEYGKAYRWQRNER